jgi:hypothetical protein
MHAWQICTLLLVIGNDCWIGFRPGHHWTGTQIRTWSMRSSPCLLTGNWSWGWPPLLASTPHFAGPASPRGFRYNQVPDKRTLANNAFAQRDISLTGTRLFSTQTCRRAIPFTDSLNGFSLIGYLTVYSSGKRPSWLIPIWVYSSPLSQVAEHHHTEEGLTSVQKGIEFFPV